MEGAWKEELSEMRSGTPALLALSGVGFCMSKCGSLLSSGVSCLAWHSTSPYSTCSRLAVVFGKHTFQKPHPKCDVQKCLLKVIRAFASCLCRMEILMTQGYINCDSSNCIHNMYQFPRCLQFSCVLKSLQSYEFWQPGGSRILASTC